jgi:hypothetical protein
MRTSDLICISMGTPTNLLQNWVYLPIYIIYITIILYIIPLSKNEKYCNIEFVFQILETILIK